MKPMHNDCGKVELSTEELRIIHQSLNEVCHGFILENFIEKIGVSKHATEALMDELGDIYDKAILDRLERVNLMKISSIHVDVYINALIETCKEVEDWEFHPKIGTEKVDAERLIDKLKKIRCSQ